MKWCEVSIQTTHEAVELIAEIFRDLGASGVVIEDPELVNDYITSGKWDYTDIPIATETEVVTEKAYLPVNGELAGRLQTFRQELKALEGRGVNIAPGTIETNELQDEDWSDTWKQYFHTEKPGERVVIKPTWESYEAEADEVVIELDPGAAFGTGTHETTRLVISLLEEELAGGERVLDVGTGSGILAICARKLGAASCAAYDIDPVAVKVARENFRENGCPDISVGVSDLLRGVSLEGGAFDICLANIVAEILCRMAPDLPRCLTSGGRVIVSGIVRDKAEEVDTAMKAAGFERTNARFENDWVAMVYRKKN